MMSDSRTKNTKRNLISALVQEFAIIFFPFITRTLLLYKLGEEYQGLNGLFTSILSVLNLSDLGFSSAVVYILYKPIAEDNTDQVCAIISYFRKVYRVIGLVVLTVGLVLMPFLPYLIKGTYPGDINLYALYFVYLANSVVSYWLFAYKSALFNALQRADIVNRVVTITKTLMNLTQIVVLLLFANYYIYIICMPLFTIMNNLLLEYVSRKYFHQYMPRGDIQSDTKTKLIQQVKGVFINRVGDVARNSADNLFISSFIGLTAVAIYNNYYYIYQAVYGISMAISNSLSGSVGNSIAKENPKKNYNDMCKFTFIFSWFCGICTVCLFCLYQPFMYIWMRGETRLMLSELNKFLLCLYFYAITMNNIRNQYSNGAGLFWDLRAFYILEAGANIILNYFLGKNFGITGIILATLITIIVFNFISRTNVLFKKYFQTSPAQYYMQYVVNLGITIVTTSVCYYLCSIVPGTGMKSLLIKAVICLVSSNTFFLLFYNQSKQFKEAVFFLKKLGKQ